jgi:chromate reductase, NAD(P)H dehydrogenase (quinone)
VRLITVCGSLQHRSANHAALAVASAIAIERGATVDDFDRLGEIPAFNPERGEEPIDVIEDWRRRIDEADALLVAAPEYAGGLAGVIKNALDWLVGSATVYRKPVGVISAGTSGGEHARRMLTQTLTWQGAYVVAELGISTPRTKSDDAGAFTDIATVDSISTLSALLVDTASMSPAQLRQLALDVVGRLGIDSSHVIAEL